MEDRSVRNLGREMACSLIQTSELMHFGRSSAQGKITIKCRTFGSIDPRRDLGCKSIDP